MKFEQNRIWCLAIYDSVIAKRIALSKEPLPAGMFYEPLAVLLDRYGQAGGDMLSAMLAKGLDELLMGWPPTDKTLLVVKPEKDIHLVDLDDNETVAAIFFVAGPAKVKWTTHTVKVATNILDSENDAFEGDDGPPEMTFGPDTHEVYPDDRDVPTMIAECLTRAASFLNVGWMFKDEMRLTMIHAAAARIATAQGLLKLVKGTSGGSLGERLDGFLTWPTIDDSAPDNMLKTLSDDLTELVDWIPQPAC